MLSKFIKQLREKHNLTQEFLASELGISRPTYFQIEQGERDMTVKEAKKLAEIFDVSFENFLQGKDFRVVVKIKKSKRAVKQEKPEIRISVPQEKVDKFKQILLYILKKIGGKPNVGMTVLYKILYFIDFDYYEKFEDQLMGLVYLKNHYGPTPLLFEKLIESMVKDGEVEIVRNSKFYQYPQTKYLVNPAIEPDLSILNGQEKEHIDQELQRLSDLTAADLTELSHKDIPWISAENGKPLDYESVFYRTAETSVRNYGNDEED